MYLDCHILLETRWCRIETYHTLARTLRVKLDKTLHKLLYQIENKK